MAAADPDRSRSAVIVDEAVHSTLLSHSSISSQTTTDTIMQIHIYTEKQTNACTQNWQTETEVLHCKVKKPQLA